MKDKGSKTNLQHAYKEFLVDKGELTSRKENPNCECLFERRAAVSREGCGHGGEIAK